MKDKELYTTDEIAAMFGLSNGYLRNLRHQQAGAKYLKIGRMVRYRKEDVQDWLNKVSVVIEPQRLGLVTA